MRRLTIQVGTPGHVLRDMGPKVITMLVQFGL